MSDVSATLGQRLRAVREKKGLSAQKAADELHLDGWVIEGLESGDYQRIGPAVYAKGHLKRYAELLGLPAAEILEGFDGYPSVIDPPTPAAGLRMRTSAEAAGKLPVVPIAGLVLAVAIVAGIIWWRPWHSSTPVAARPAGAPRDTATPTVAAAPAADLSGPPGAAVTPPPSLPDAITLAASGGSPAIAAPSPAAGAGRARLRLSFVGDSWVDIHDAAGQRLFAGNGHINNVRSMSGIAPFRVYLKEASSIRLEINNRLVVVAPQFIVGNVAHFEAGADGVLRRDPRAAAGTALPAAPGASAGSAPRG